MWWQGPTGTRPALTWFDIQTLKYWSDHKNHCKTTPVSFEHFLPLKNAKFWIADPPKTFISQLYVKISLYIWIPIYVEKISHKMNSDSLMAITTRSSCKYVKVRSFKWQPANLPSFSNLKPIFWQWQSKVELSNENQENQMKHKWRFTKISEAEIESGWFPSKSDFKIALSALSCCQMWSGGKSGQIVNIWIWQELATKFLDLVKLWQTVNSQNTLSLFLVPCSNLDQLWLLAPQSGALRISAYRDYQSHPIPSYHL